MKRRNPFPGLTSKPDRHGKIRHRLRKRVKGRIIDAYLPGPYGSEAFRAAYFAALESEGTGTPRRIDTFFYLIEARIASPSFRSLAPSTKAQKLKRLDLLRQKIGDSRFADMKPRHVEAIMARVDGPTAANRLRQELAELFDLAARLLDYSLPNPARLAQTIKIKTEGWHSVTDAEIAIFRAAYPSSTPPRLAFELLFGTAAARADVVAMTRANIENGRISYGGKRRALRPICRSHLSLQPNWTSFRPISFCCFKRARA